MPIGENQSCKHRILLYAAYCLLTHSTAPTKNNYSQNGKAARASRKQKDLWRFKITKGVGHASQADAKFTNAIPETGLCSIADKALAPF